jgi:hypothetical protein
MHDLQHASWVCMAVLLACDPEIRLKGMVVLLCGRLAPEDAGKCAILRDLLGPLTFRDVAVPPSCLAWNNGTVVKLAQAIYTDRAFDRLPILADALEDAGCTSQDILNHCRQPGEHCRGCWVLDLLLSKQ